MLYQITITIDKSIFSTDDVEQLEWAGYNVVDIKEVD
jgi:hypothetical protein